MTEPRTRTLPDFDDPPAVETVLGVRFSPLKGWQAPHFGLYWNQIRGEYPRVEIHSAIGSADAPVYFHFPEQPQTQFEVPVRCWFFNAKESTLIQIQRDRFLHNWRKLEHTQPYLHYDELKPEFEKHWKGFREFLRVEGFDEPRVAECEVTYVNQIDRGKGWESFADLSNVVTSWCAGKPDNFLPDPNLVSFNAVYPMQEKEGTLRVILQPAFRTADNKETIQLVMVGQCRPAGSGYEDIAACLDAARRWVVQGFADMTTARMHEIWRRKT